MSKKKKSIKIRKNNKKVKKGKIGTSYLSSVMQAFPYISNSFNFNYEKKDKLTYGQIFADKLSTWAGSWTFIIGFVVFLIVWMFINIRGWLGGWDPYPFILLNLVLSCIAALQAPVILMSQNRAAERDRHKAEMDYMVNRKAERENLTIIKDLEQIKKKLKIK